MNTHSPTAVRMWKKSLVIVLAGGVASTWPASGQEVFNPTQLELCLMKVAEVNTDTLVGAPVKVIPGSDMGEPDLKIIEWTARNNDNTPVDVSAYRVDQEGSIGFEVRVSPSGSTDEERIVWHTHMGVDEDGSPYTFLADQKHTPPYRQATTLGGQTNYFGFNENDRPGFERPIPPDSALTNKHERTLACFTQFRMPHK